MNQVVAIDGPSASGKSTVAKIVAGSLGWLYVDSGALYRGVTLLALRRDVDCGDEVAVTALLESIPMTFYVEQGAVRFKVEGRDPGDEIRTQRVNENVSKVAAMPVVRRQVVAWLRKMREHGNLVMEGRDIGTAVFPETEFKFYLDASAEERARRRHAELVGKEGISLTQVDDSLKKRDAIDSSRKMDPLRVADGAWRVDSTALGREEVARVILEKVKAVRGA